MPPSGVPCWHSGSDRKPGAEVGLLRGRCAEGRSGRSEKVVTTEGLSGSPRGLGRPGAAADRATRVWRRVCIRTHSFYFGGLGRRCSVQPRTVTYRLRSDRQLSALRGISDRDLQFWPRRCHDCGEQDLAARVPNPRCDRGGGSRGLDSLQGQTT